MKQGGLRTNNKIKYSSDTTPLVSIVTVVRNCEQFIEQTILSVINQSYSNIEYIIVDGDSTDKTLDIIKTYEDRIDYWLSEPDAGIYDAMNKGIKLATGEYINFMNGGDAFYNLEVCKLIFSEIKIHNNDVIYGDTLSNNDDFGFSILVKAKPINQIWEGMFFSHQSCFCRLRLLQNQLFNTKYKIAADFNLILTLFLSGKTFNYLQTPISMVRSGGISYSNINTLLEETKIIHAQKPYSFKLLKLIIPFIICTIRIVIGSKMTNFIRKYKWKFHTKIDNNQSI